MRAIIIDMDGTLADVQHRVHLLQGEKRWREFHDAMEYDTLVEPLAQLIRALKTARLDGEDIAVLVVTARHDDPRYETMTRDFLEAGGVPFDRLYMRAEGDYRPDRLVKADILERIMDDGFEPLWAIDDRPEIIELWRSHGIMALQCAEGPRQSQFAGETLLTMLVGPCSAGKSTYAKAHYPDHEVISTDALRMQLYGDLGQAPEALKRVWKLAHGMIRARLEAGCHTVLDATNLDPDDRAKVLALLPDGVFCRYVVIDRDLETKIREGGWRDEELVLKQHRLFRKHEKDIMAGDGHPYVTVQDKRTR